MSQPRLSTPDMGVSTPNGYRGFVVRRVKSKLMPDTQVGTIPVLFENIPHIVDYPKSTLRFESWPVRGLTALQEDRLCRIEAWCSHYDRDFWWGEDSDYQYVTIMSLLERGMLRTVNSQWCVRPTLRCKAYLYNKQKLHQKLFLYTQELDIQDLD